MLADHADILRRETSLADIHAAKAEGRAISN